jgi:hypothetical protein
MFANNCQTNWANWIPLTKFTYNNVVQEATGQTPFFMNKGRNPHALPLDPMATSDMLASTYLDMIQKVGRKVEECLHKAKTTMEKQ